MTKHELLLKALRTLLIGACVELTFARGYDVHHTAAENGQTMKMSSRVASGVKILGGNNETVLSLLTAKASLSHKLTTSPFVGEGSEDKAIIANGLAAANDSSLMTQQNSVVPGHDHDSSSFLYDTKSQRVDQSTSHPLQLESFLETQQSGCAPSQSVNDNVAFSDHAYGDDMPDIEASQQIIRELESEWENSQQIQWQTYKEQLPGDMNFDLALSEDMVSELQQTFDLSKDLELPATIARSSLTTAAADTTLKTVTPLSKFTKTMSCYGTPELFSSCKPSHKKQGRVGELHVSEQSSFSPELFGPTPLVCRHCSSPANLSAATPSGLRSKIHTPKRFLLHDSTLATPFCPAAAVSQASRLSTTSSNKLENSCISTPQTQSKESYIMSCAASSPDLFS